MPVTIMIGLLALLVALVAYSWGTLKAFRAKAVSRASVTLLWVGFAFDVLATAMMAIENGGIARDIHTLLAFVVMAGMLLAAIFGSRALSKKDAGLSATVARWTVLPWVAWVLMTVWALTIRR